MNCTNYRHPSFLMFNLLLFEYLLLKERRKIINFMETIPDMYGFCRVMNEYDEIVYDYNTSIIFLEI